MGGVARGVFFVAVAFLIPAVSLGAQASFLVDSNVHTPPNFYTMAPPSVGGSYVDPVFGTVSMRLTDATALSEQGIAPEYSQTASFNLDDTYLVLLWLFEGVHHLYDRLAVISASSLVVNQGGHGSIRTISITASESPSDGST